MTKPPSSERIYGFLTEPAFNTAAAKTKLNENSIQIGRDYLVGGFGFRETAFRNSTTRGRVHEIAARISTIARKNS